MVKYEQASVFTKRYVPRNRKSIREVYHESRLIDL